MRAVVLQARGQVGVANVPAPTLLESTDAIVRVTLSGICGTDLHVVRGDFAGIQPGAILGHEFVGEVVEVGRAVQRIRLGDKVMSSDFTACGRCAWCDEGHHWHCADRAFFGTGTSFGPALPGAQAEFVRVPHADTTLGRMPVGLSDEAALLMADNLATAWAAVERARLRPGDCAVVIGGGAVGQLTALAAQAAGAGVVVVVEPHVQRRAFAQANGSLATTPGDAIDLVRKANGSPGADVVLEAVGGTAPMDLAIQIARPGARIVSVGAHSDATWSFPIAQAFRNELTVGFAIGDSIRLRQRLTRMVVAGTFDPTVVIDARAPVEQAPELYRRLAAQERLKAVLTF